MSDLSDFILVDPVQPNEGGFREEGAHGGGDGVLYVMAETQLEV